MHYGVSEGMQAMALQVVRNHPNAWDVQVLRKVVTRPDETGTMGGAPNFGGIGVLDSQDENQYEYAWLCNAHAVKGEGFQPGNMTDRLDMAITSAQEFIYLLAPAREAPQEVKDLGFKTKDVVLFLMGVGADAARAAYEVASVDATCELPPHLPRYVLNRRADMDVPAGALDPDEEEEEAPDAGEADDGNSVSSPPGGAGEIGGLSDLTDL